MASRVRILARPSLEEARAVLAEYLSKRPLIVMLASCETLYEGRGASRSSAGDRVVIIKPDGSLIVHGPRGFKPLNWQPDTSSILAVLEDNALVVKAFRRSVREVLVVRCLDVEAVIVAESPSEGEFYMYLSEREIHEVIKSNPWLVEEGFQVLDSEKPLDLGVADLYGRDSRGNPVVVEVKRVKATEEAVRQLGIYIEALRARGVHARGVLLAPGATESALRLAALYGIELKHLDLRRVYELASASKPRVTLADYMAERGRRKEDAGVEGSERG